MREKTITRLTAGGQEDRTETQGWRNKVNDTSTGRNFSY